MAKCISADALKWIAVISMCIDHTAAVVLKGYFQLSMEEIPREQWHIWENAYDIMRAVGRMAFPLFAFLLVEGFCHTRSRRKYGLRLLAAAVCSEIPYDLAICGQVFSLERQNTIFTLLVGFLILNLLHEIRFSHGGRYVLTAAMEILTVAAGCLFACLCRLDYSWKGILLIVIFYLFYGYQNVAAVAGFCLFSSSFWSIFAFLLLPFYSGRKSGKHSRRKRGSSGRLFYVFYPLHLLLLAGILRLWAA